MPSLPDANLIVRPLNPHDPAEVADAEALFRLTPAVGTPPWYELSQLEAHQSSAATAVTARARSRTIEADGAKRTNGSINAGLRTAVDAAGAADECALVAVVEGRVRGLAWVTLSVHPLTDQPKAHLEDLATHPEVEGRGIGDRLLQAAEAWARTHGATSLTLHVWPGNTRARGFYAHRGFRADMLRLQKSLTESGDHKLMELSAASADVHLRAERMAAVAVTPLVQRVWRGRVRMADSEAYLAFLQARAVPDYLAVRGNRGVHIGRRSIGDEVEFECVTWWESEEAIRKFAGDDLTRAKYYPEDVGFLLAFPERVIHSEIFPAPHSVGPTPLW